MATQIYRRTTTEEKLVWFGLVSTYAIYAIGGLYVTGSALGWLIIAVYWLRLTVDDNTRSKTVPAMVWLWVFCMFVMLVVLWIGHANWELGLGKTIKSSIGWAKGWALIAVFIFIGAMCRIRRELLIRAVCILATHSLVFAIITFMAYMVRIPGEIFVSPLQIVGGPGPSFFTVSLYGLNPETGAGRWQFFGPWAPSAGLLSCLYLVFCFQEKDPKWRTLGIMGCIAMCLLSKSRAGQVIFLCLWPMLMFSDKLAEPWFLLMLGVVIPALLILGQPLYEYLMDSYEAIKQARPGSTRVRKALEQLALQRWQAEAPYFGHGIVEPGSKYTASMPIGSHHSWYGLLFVKGIVGLLALAIPMVITLFYLFWRSLFCRTAQVGLCLITVFICYSFFENLEILSYLYWPALIWIGMALNPESEVTEHVAKV